MNVLLVGGGGREHSIAWKLKQSKKVDKLYCAPGNGGIAQLATCLNVPATDLNGIIEAVKAHGIDFVVVAPDDPLAAGLVDMLEAEGIRAFGPSKVAAQIEASKSFAKDLMKKYGIPTAEYEVFMSYDEAVKALDGITYPIVIKADGLALGKGVLICEDQASAVEALKAMMIEHVFGTSGSRIVMEQFLTGPEVSLLVFTDGKTIKPMVSAQDHKRALDNDKGLNTGGMGAFAPTAKFTPQIRAWTIEHIVEPTVKAMAAEGRPFKGVLYFGLMITADGPKVIEYNARFGDPETQAVLPLLKTDLMDIFEWFKNGLLLRRLNLLARAPYVSYLPRADTRSYTPKVLRSAVLIHSTAQTTLWCSMPGQSLKTDISLPPADACWALPRRPGIWTAR